ncbi:MAG: tetratricopeptide repeat protein [Acidobacteriales bacterium]|nr:tetratricopeptide repeat protein [Terriglobales bacterium]
MRAQTRHQLKQDKFSRVTLDAAGATVHWSAEHKSRILIGAGICLVIAAAVLGAWYHINQQDLRASADLNQAVRVLNTPIRPEGMPAQPDDPSFASAKERATEAQKKLQAIIQQYPHTRSAEIAHYLDALTDSQLGDNATAERELKAVAGYHNSDISSLAQFALAALYRNNNRYQEAIEIYKKLIDKPTNAVGKVTSEVELAATYAAQQQPTEARKLYEQIQKENPSGPAAQLASAKLQELK